MKSTGRSDPPHRVNAPGARAGGTGRFLVPIARLPPILLIAAAASVPSGCAAPFEAIDRSLARAARVALVSQERPPRFDGERDEDEPAVEPSPRRGSVFLAELVAIFPGILWPGLGHRYAGDIDTYQNINQAGQSGYLFLALGGGTLVGAHYLDHTDQPAHNYAVPLYATGGVMAGIGVGFYVTAWIYDLIDTPRAVRTGGQPPPEGTLFRRDLKDFWDR